MLRRPVIAPGLQVHTRPDGELQIGLSPQHQLRIADSAVARRTLAALDRGETPSTDRESQRVLDRLGPALRDGDALVRPGVPTSEVAAVSLRHPRTARDRLAARQGTAVRIVGDVGVDPRPLIRASGLRESVGDDLGVALVLSLGEPDRADLDPLLRDLVPHLLVRLVEGDVILGPFVGPGLTACLRCLDAHRAAEDPTYPLLVSGSVRISRGDAVSEPVDAALTTIAVGWAVRDLVRYAEGDLASTWSSTVLLGADRSTFAPERWWPHPACGCGWGRAA